MIDESTEFGARVARHLREDIVVWMTTVTPDGSPLPMPVWFHWDGGGGDIVVLSGNAAVADELPPADQHREYLGKYDEHIARIGMTPETFAQRYSVPVRIELGQLRGH